MTQPDRPVRVRFAPSPTGYLHIGGARTALFNWLFAKKHDGAFILRIEDTDQKRYVADSEEDILTNLRWLGLNWDEGPDIGGPHGPYRQSERAVMYQKWTNWLIENGHAYRCNATAEELGQMREEQKARDEKPGYDRRNREANLSAAIGEHVVRFKMPMEGETVIHDVIRGDVTFTNDDIRDPVLMKSDGLPTYHLANVVDDHSMEISHILRAVEWLSSAPLHYQLYQAFGWEMPKLVHLPLILNEDGSKMSKRDRGANVSEWRATMGYLPEALVNGLTNTGWAFGEDREIFTVNEVLPRFELENINPAGSRLPYDKLEWLNGVYIREMDSAELARRVRPYLEAAGYEVDDERLHKAVPIIQERIKTLSEAIDYIAFIFRGTITIDSADDIIQRKMDAEGTIKIIDAVVETLENLPDFEPDTQEKALRALAKEIGFKAGQVFGTIRTATTGQRVAPPLFETNEILGRELVIERLKAARQMLVEKMEADA